MGIYPLLPLLSSVISLKPFIIFCTTTETVSSPCHPLIHNAFSKAREEGGRTIYQVWWCFTVPNEPEKDGSYTFSPISRTAPFSSFFFFVKTMCEWLTKRSYLSMAHWVKKKCSLQIWYVAAEAGWRLIQCATHWIRGISTTSIQQTLNCVKWDGVIKVEPGYKVIFTSK